MRTPITHIRYIALAVPCFASERRFFAELWGLVEESGGKDHAFFSARGSPEPFVLRLRAADDRKADLFAFAAESREGVDTLFAHLRAKAVKLLGVPRDIDGARGYGFRLFDPEGRLIEISADVPLRESPAAPARSGVPQGLAHVVFETPRIVETVTWYEEMLGLRVADWLDSAMCFLRGNTSKHHCLAFMNGPATLNHVAFEMPTTDDVMRGLGRMLQHDIQLNWGPGRHVAGDNTFAYFRSPAGNTVEFTAEIEHLPDDWTPRVLPRTAETIDQWLTGRMVEGTGTAANWQSQIDPGLWRDDAFAPYGETLVESR